MRDSGWLCIADVHASYHGFSTNHRVYGVIVDAETLVQVYPKVTDASPTLQTNRTLG